MAWKRLDLLAKMAGKGLDLAEKVVDATQTGGIIDGAKRLGSKALLTILDPDGNYTQVPLAKLVADEPILAKAIQEALAKHIGLGIPAAMGITDEAYVAMMLSHVTITKASIPKAKQVCEAKGKAILTPPIGARLPHQKLWETLFVAPGLGEADNNNIFNRLGHLPQFILDAITTIDEPVTNKPRDLANPNKKAYQSFSGKEVQALQSLKLTASNPTAIFTDGENLKPITTIPWIAAKLALRGNQFLTLAELMMLIKSGVYDLPNGHTLYSPTQGVLRKGPEGKNIQFPGITHTRRGYELRSIASTKVPNELEGTTPKAIAI